MEARLRKLARELIVSATDCAAALAVVETGAFRNFVAIARRAVPQSSTWVAGRPATFGVKSLSGFGCFTYNSGTGFCDMFPFQNLTLTSTGKGVKTHVGNTGSHQEHHC